MATASRPTTTAKVAPMAAIIGTGCRSSWLMNRLGAALLGSDIMSVLPSQSLEDRLGLRQGRRRLGRRRAKSSQYGPLYAAGDPRGEPSSGHHRGYRKSSSVAELSTINHASAAE